MPVFSGKAKALPVSWFVVCAQEVHCAPGLKQGEASSLCWVQENTMCERDRGALAFRPASHVAWKPDDFHSVVPPCVSFTLLLLPHQAVFLEQFSCHDRVTIFPSVVVKWQRYPLFPLPNPLLWVWLVVLVGFFVCLFILVCPLIPTSLPRLSARELFSEAVGRAEGERLFSLN